MEQDARFLESIFAGAAAASNDGSDNTEFSRDPLIFLREHLAVCEHQWSARLVDVTDALEHVAAARRETAHWVMAEVLKESNIAPVACLKCHQIDLVCNHGLCATTSVFSEPKKNRLPLRNGMQNHLKQHRVNASVEGALVGCPSGCGTMFYMRADRSFNSSLQQHVYNKHCLQLMCNTHTLEAGQLTELYSKKKIAKVPPQVLVVKGAHYNHRTSLLYLVMAGRRTGATSKLPLEVWCMIAKLYFNDHFADIYC